MAEYIERVLIVLNEDGTLRGAHQERLARDPSGTFPDRVYPAEPISDEAKALVIAALEAGE